MSRNTTTDTRNFSIFFLKKSKKLETDSYSWNNNIIWSRHEEETARIGYNISTSSESPYIELNYKSKSYSEEEWTPINYKVPLESVKCNFGGIRWFFRCPLYRSGQYCGRRVAVLYSVGNYFGCRHCADLTYETCNQGKRFRGFPFEVLTKGMKADELYEKISRTYYAGKPTKKYRRYLKLAGQINRIDALGALEDLLKGDKM